MTGRYTTPDSRDPTIPAGFTYLGQFVAHDLTFDRTAAALGSAVSVQEMVQGRSPALDLDSLYGRGPTKDPALYQLDGMKLRTGTTASADFPRNDPGVNVDRAGFDLARVGEGSTKSERQTALIPDRRNDENLTLAQMHLAFIRFHNRVVDTFAAERPSSADDVFERTRAAIVKHYQWMIKTDFLPRIVDPDVLNDVFTRGRRWFESAASPADKPTMPVEFSVAAYRFGHSMVRDAYEWNRVFQTAGPGPVARLDLLFRFSGASGNLSPEGDPNDRDSGGFERLPTNWIIDWRRFFDFGEAKRNDLLPRAGTFNVAKKIDTLLVDPLIMVPLGALGPPGRTDRPVTERNLAFRTLVRGWMVGLPSGQEMADFFGVKPLDERALAGGDGGVALDRLAADAAILARNTPLWFYILREAELNGGRLGQVGSRIVAETFHRAMEASQISILGEPAWRPSLGPNGDTFRMVDLLLFACENRADLVNPLGDG
jgi:hypothetical protein